MIKTPLGGSRRKFFADCSCCQPAFRADSPQLGRRDVLAGGLAALGAGALGTFAARAQAQAKSKIDVHHHFLPPAHKEALDRHKMGSPKWSPQMSLDDMDKSGIATSVLSQVQPGTWWGDNDESRKLSRQINEYGAKLVRDHPGRFGLFATISPPDTDGSLKEIEYAFDTLKADGIGLLTSYDGKYLGEASFAPVYAELNRRKAVIYVHPASPLCCTSLMSYVPPFFSEFQQDTTRTILSLIFSGSISRLPDIRFIFSHAGGTLPMVAGRIEHYSTLPAFKEKVPNGFDYELKRLYYEIANAAYKPSMAAITNMVPTSQIMFGTDFPLVAIDDTANGLRALGLPPAELQAIARGNALGLFPRLKV
jgi:predicted TIM-barrel fold metal-dependent hydrolase